MLKVYCDTGACGPELSALERQGKIHLVQWNYENKNRRIKRRAKPSKPTWEETNYRFDELDVPWTELSKTSDKWLEIKRLLGTGNERDAKHLDSAYMEGCHVFLTSDKRDIASRRSQLEQLLGIKVLHVGDDWNEFISLVEASDST